MPTKDKRLDELKRQLAKTKEKRRIQEEYDKAKAKAMYYAHKGGRELLNLDGLGGVVFTAAEIADMVRNTDLRFAIRRRDIYDIVCQLIPLPAGSSFWIESDGASTFYAGDDPDPSESILEWASLKRDNYVVLHSFYQHDDYGIWVDKHGPWGSNTYVEIKPRLVGGFCLCEHWGDLEDLDEGLVQAITGGI